MARLSTFSCGIKLARPFVVISVPGFLGHKYLFLLFSTTYLASPEIVSEPLRSVWIRSRRKTVSKRTIVSTCQPRQLIHSSPHPRPIHAQDIAYSLSISTSVTVLRYCGYL